MLKVEVLEALRNPHQVRILLLLRARGPLRFNQIQDELGLNPAQVDRALKRLFVGNWIGLRTIPGRPAGGSIRVEYEITASGETLTKAFRAFVAVLKKEPNPVPDRGLDALLQSVG